MQKILGDPTKWALRFLLSLLCSLQCIFGVSESVASEESTAKNSGYFRRLVVFPFQLEGLPKEINESLWWQARDLLTQDRRFLLAGQSFMIRKDVFQPRANLNVSDVVLLARVLDGEGLMTLFSEDRDIVIKVYNGKSGLLFWESRATLNIQVPVKDQLKEIVPKLIRDFLDELPFHGFTTESLNSKQLEVTAAASEMILNRFEVVVGDDVEFFLLGQDNLRPLFQGGGLELTLGLGKIREISSGGELKVSIEKWMDQGTSQPSQQSLPWKVRKKKWKIPQQTLFRIMKVSRGVDLRKSELLQKESLPQDLLAMERAPEQERLAEYKPLATVLNFVASLVAFFFLAF